jgi:hypothetical protein
METVRVMREVAHARSSHPLVRGLALKILQFYGIKSHDFVNEARAIGDYVRSKVRYVRDCKSVEQLHDPITMIDQIQQGSAQGDCDDMSLLIAAMLLSIGHQPFFRVIEYRRGSGSFNHIYVVDYDKRGPGRKRERVVLDAIVKHQPIGFEVRHDYGKEIAV